MANFFTHNAYFKAVTENNLSKELWLADDAMQQRPVGRQLDYARFRGCYKNDYWVLKKVVALPMALWCGVVKTTFHISLAVFSSPSLLFTEGRYCKSSCWYVLHDMHESIGWLITLFNDTLGQSHVQESRFHKECLDCYTAANSMDEYLRRKKNLNSDELRFLALEAARTGNDPVPSWRQIVDHNKMSVHSEIISQFIDKNNPIGAKKFFTSTHYDIARLDDPHGGVKNSNNNCFDIIFKSLLEKRHLDDALEFTAHAKNRLDEVGIFRRLIQACLDANNPEKALEACQQYSKNHPADLTFPAGRLPNDVYAAIAQKFLQQKKLTNAHDIARNLPQDLFPDLFRDLVFSTALYSDGQDANYITVKLSDSNYDSLVTNLLNQEKLDLAAENARKISDYTLRATLLDKCAVRYLRNNELDKALNCACGNEVLAKIADKAFELNEILKGVMALQKMQASPEKEAAILKHLKAISEKFEDDVVKEAVYLFRDTFKDEENQAAINFMVKALIEKRTLSFAVLRQAYDRNVSIQKAFGEALTALDKDSKENGEAGKARHFCFLLENDKCILKAPYDAIFKKYKDSYPTLQRKQS